jgi:hypothetical protein
MLARKNLLLSDMVLFVLLCSSLVVSVKASSTWSQTYGGTGDEGACSLVVTPDGGYAIAGYTDSFGAGILDFWLVKTDAFGNMEWNRAYGGTGYEEAYSLVVTPDGGYAIAGSTTSFGAGGFDFWLVKTDASGNMQWNKTYGGAYYDEAYSLVATSDGGYAIAGITWSFGAGESDFWLVKTDAVGNMEWNRTYGGTGYDRAYSLIATSDGGYAIAGEQSSFGSDGAWLVKTDSLGNMQWNKTYGVPGDSFTSVVQTSDGGYALTDSGFSLVKIDALGNMQWNKTYVGTNISIANSLVATSDGGYAVAGTTGVRDFEGGCDFWLVKTDSLGNVQWNQTYGGGNEWLYSLVATSDGGYAMAGWTGSFGAGEGDIWLVKTNENGFVQEYASWLVPALVLTSTAFIIIDKKRLLRRRP